MPCQKRSLIEELGQDKKEVISRVWRVLGMCQKSLRYRSRNNYFFKV
jgi:hypothetical protein